MEPNTENQNSEHVSPSSSATVTAEKKDKFLPVSILVAAIVIGGAVVFASIYKSGSAVAPTAPAGQTPTAAAGTTPSSSTLASLMMLTSRDAILGNANAPVTIIEYGDYQCPYCGRYFSTIQPQIVSQYINTGKARMVFRDLAFLGPESTIAANAAQCAEDQNKLWPYHDALYTAKVGDVAKGGSEDDGFFTTALFIKLAQQVGGMNMSTFTSCVDNNQDASIVSAEASAAAAVGVNSTPVTFVNGVEVMEDGQSAGADPTAVLGAIQSAVAASH